MADSHIDAVIKSLEPEMLKQAISQLDAIADEVKKQLIDETEEGIADFYEYPEGKHYVRSGRFQNGAYVAFDHRDYSSVEKAKAVVGVYFNPQLSYRYPIRGISNEDIYDWNIQGKHPDGNGLVRGESTNIIMTVNELADEIAADLVAGRFSI